MQHITERVRFLFEVWGNTTTKSRNLTAKKLRIERSRFTRIWNGADLYHHEVMAIKNYFIGTSYEWLLEGRDTDAYQENMVLLTTHLRQELTDKQTRELADELRRQKEKGP